MTPDDTTRSVACFGTTVTPHHCAATLRGSRGKLQWHCLTTKRKQDGDRPYQGHGKRNPPSQLPLLPLGSQKMCGKSLTSCTCTHTQVVQKRCQFQHIDVLFCPPVMLLDGRPTPRERRVRSNLSGPTKNQPRTKLHVRTSMICPNEPSSAPRPIKMPYPEAALHCRNDNCLRRMTLETECGRVKLGS